MNPFALPSGQNSGDTFPIFRDGVCHLFHMMMPVIAHHISRDLLHWEARPVVVSPGAPGEPDSGTNCTGCVVEDHGRFYCFYTGNQNICLAVSDDLDHWTKHAGNPVLEGDNVQYRVDYFRDPFVFPGPDGAWWMLAGSRTMAQPGQRAGCVALATSGDLLHWRLQPPLWAPGIGPHTDCPQLIHHGERWYLLYLQRNGRYRVAQAPTGPFCRPPARNIGSLLLAAASRPAWDGRRWVTFPFFPRLAKDDDLGGFIYGGPLAVPRQLDFQPDGTLTERFVDEFISAVTALPDAGDPLAGARALAGQWALADRRAACVGDTGGTLLLHLDGDGYLEGDIHFTHLDSDFHLLLRVDESLLSGYQVALHPRTGQVSLRAISEFGLDTVLASRTVALPVNTPIRLRAVMQGSMLEVSLADRVSLTARLYNSQTGRVGLEFRDAPGMVEHMHWRVFG